MLLRRSCLVRGGPGAGKTTIGLHFLAAGVAAGESALYITMEESEECIWATAASSGLGITRVSILDISPSSDFFASPALLRTLLGTSVWTDLLRSIEGFDLATAYELLQRHLGERSGDASEPSNA